MFISAKKKKKKGKEKNFLHCFRWGMGRVRTTILIVSINAPPALFFFLFSHLVFFFFFVFFLRYHLFTYLYF